MFEDSGDGCETSSCPPVDEVNRSFDIVGLDVVAPLALTDGYQGIEQIDPAKSGDPVLTGGALVVPDDK